MARGKRVPPTPTHPPPPLPPAPRQVPCIVLLTPLTSARAVQGLLLSPLPSPPSPPPHPITLPHTPIPPFARARTAPIRGTARACAGRRATRLLRATRRAKGTRTTRRTASASTASAAAEHAAVGPGGLRAAAHTWSSEAHPRAPSGRQSMSPPRPGAFPCGQTQTCATGQRPSGYAFAAVDDCTYSCR